MFSLIFSLVFCLFAGLAAFIGVLRGRKYKWQLSLSRIIVAVVVAIIAAGLAALLSNLIARLVISILLQQSWLQNLGNVNVAEIIAGIPSGESAIGALVSMILAPFLFWPLFAGLKAISNLFVKMITNAILAATDKGDKDADKKYVERKNYKEKYEPLVAHHANYVGGALGAVCSVIVFFICLIPLAGLFNVLGEIAPLALSPLKDSADFGSAIEISLDAVDGAANNIGTKTVNFLGGRPLYGFMTTSNVDGEMTNLNTESKLLATTASVVTAIMSDGVESKETATAIRKLPPAFNESAVVRVLVAELCASASENWDAGEGFHGIARPSLGEDMKPLTDAIFDVFATSDKNNIKGDVKAIAEVFAIVAEDGLIDNFTEIKSDPQKVLSDEQTNARILAVVLEDTRLDPLIDGLADFGISMMLKSVNSPSTRQSLFYDFVDSFNAVKGSDPKALCAAYADVLDDYGIVSDGEIEWLAAEAKLNSENMREWCYSHIAKDADEFASKTVIISLDMLTGDKLTLTDRKHEAEALSHAFAVISGLTGDLKGDSFDVKKLLATMGTALDAFAETETVGVEKTELMLVAILQSAQVHDQIGFSVIEATNTAKSISENSANDSYASLMGSLSGIVEMLEAASDSTKNTKEAVDKMLENLTPEAASVMETMATPSVVKNYGVPESSAEPVSTMISGTFGNLKDVPAEDYEKESAAVSDMMNVMMTITEDGASGSSVFGGEDSVTQITEQEYVDNIMNSTAMSKTVVDTVYGNGTEPVVDPLKSNRKLSADESASLVTALNNNWSSSDKSEETAKQITSIAAIMNISVSVTDSGVVAN